MKRATPLWAVVFLVLMVAPQTWAKKEGTRTLTLREAISIALKDSPLVQARHSALEASRENVKAVWGSHLPQIDLEGGYTRLSDPVAVVPIKGFARRPPFFSKNIYEWKTVSYLTLYQGGRISRMVDMARLEEAVSSAQVRLTQEELVANVTNIFHRIIQLEALKAAQEEALKALEKVRQDTANLLKVGRAAPVDLMRIETQVAAQRQDLTTTRELIRRTRETLAYFLGWPPTTQIEPRGQLKEEPFHLQTSLEEALKRRPDVLAARKKVEEAEKKISYEMGAHLPHVYLASSYGKKAGAGFHGEEEVWQAGLYLKLNLFSGGTISARVREARARLLEAQNILLDTRLKASREILNAASSIKEARARIEAARTALESSRESFRIEKLKYLSRAGTVTDMLMAQAQWLNARARYYQALYDYQAALVAYKLATATILEDVKR